MVQQPRSNKVSRARLRQFGTSIVTSDNFQARGRCGVFVAMADADETKPDVGNMEHVNIKVKSQVRRLCLAQRAQRITPPPAASGMLMFIAVKTRASTWLSVAFACTRSPFLWHRGPYLKETLQILGAALQDGAVVCFKAKRTTQLRKLMKAYCERQGALLVLFDWRGCTVLASRDLPVQCPNKTIKLACRTQGSPRSRCPSCMTATACGALCSCAKQGWFEQSPTTVAAHSTACCCLLAGKR